MTETTKVITKLLYLLNQGESFTKVEATEMLFSVTKLFQSRDTGLRRMVYLMIKELSPCADEVIIVTSLLMKDMNSMTLMYRANAIRVLWQIIDGTLLKPLYLLIKGPIMRRKVRDRATLYLNMLEGDGTVVETEKDVKDFLFGSLDILLANLEISLKNYAQEPSEEPFDIDSVPKEVKAQPLAEKKATGKKPAGLGAAPTGTPSTVDTYERLFSSIPEFSSFGKLFKIAYPGGLYGCSC